MDILDEAPQEGNTDLCQTKVVPLAEAQGVDISEWFDTVNINVNYICAKSVMDHNPKLAEQIAT